MVEADVRHSYEFPTNLALFASLCVHVCPVPCSRPCHGSFDDATGDVRPGEDRADADTGRQQGDPPRLRANGGRGLLLRLPPTGEEIAGHYC